MSGEEEQLVLLKYDHNVATVTLNNPPANVLSQNVIEQLCRTFQDLKHTDIAAVIITGQGGHSFCTGADIKELVENNLEQNHAYFSKIHETFNIIATCPYPVIAAVNGYAYGAGLELALCADIRVMDQNARMSAAGVNLNLVFGTQRLIRLVGPGQARDMLFCALQVNASDAREFGLVEYVVPPGTTWDKAREIAELISQKGQMAVQGVKQVLNLGIDLPLNQALNLEAEFIYRMLSTSDFAFRTKKFLVK